MPDIRRRLYNLPRLVVQQPRAAGTGAAGARASGSAAAGVSTGAAAAGASGAAAAGASTGAAGTDASGAAAALLRTPAAGPHAPAAPDTGGWAAAAACSTADAQQGPTSAVQPQQQQPGVGLMRDDMRDDMPTGTAALQERVFELSLELAKARAVLLGYVPHAAASIEA